MGTEAFARRAERELLATGERARKRTVDTLDQLTRRRRKLLGLRRKATPTERSQLSCSSARAPLSTTSARRSASSRSSRAYSSKSDCPIRRVSGVFGALADDV